VGIFMPSDIMVNKNSEFFISIAKEGTHSFLMLGVTVDGKPQLLARVGKGNLIDKGFGVGFGSMFTMFGKVVGSHTDASLMDEGISRNNNSDISYQAYAISYHQYLQFLALTKDIHLAQLKRYEDRILPEVDYRKLTYPEKGVYKLRHEGIECYYPIQEEEKEEEEEKLTFEYKNVDNFSSQSIHEEKRQNQAIIDGANEISAFNTCRTTARAILNYTLGYSPTIPALFAFGLDYNTTLTAGQPTSNTFYILPQPPNCFNVNPTQMKILNELYQKLEDLPKNLPELTATRQKFDELKQLYQEIAGTPELPLGMLLDKITAHRASHNPLFDTRRGQGLISKFLELLGIKFKTGTQQAYDRMEKAINDAVAKALPKQEEGVDQKEHKLDQKELPSDDNRPPPGKR